MTRRAQTTRIAAIGLAAMAIAGCMRIGAAASRIDEGSTSKPMEDTQAKPGTQPNGKQTAVIAGGCFWCMEAVFQQLKGVDKVESGFGGGKTANPSYEQVCTGTTGHAEAVRITFDPKVITYRDLLRIFFTVHDPTTLNRQGEDVGTQYRSAIFFRDKDQEKVAREVVAEITKERIWPDPIVTEITAYSNFYPAEDYHKDYFRRNPDKGYCRIVIAPKVAKFREKYREKLVR